VNARRIADAAAAAALLALVAAYAATQLDLSRYPEEDAAMLLRYSRHLAQGHGVVWNVGEPPVDGATDLLFMALVALLHRLGLGLETAARGVDVAAHGATVLVVYASVRRLFGAPAWVAIVPAAYLATGTGLRYAAALYGTPLFALTTALAGYAAWRTAQADTPGVERAARGLGLWAVLMGIARPEGALLGVLLLAGALVRRGRPDARRVVAGFASGFLLPGLAYFAWRWWYFGHPLPNPFYRKGGGVLHEDVLLRAARNVARLGGPFLAVLAAGLVPRATRRLALGALVPVAGFTAMWVLVSDETNYFMRFRYPILPVLLVSWVPVAQQFAARVRSDTWTSPRTARPAAAAAMVGLAAVLAVWQHRRFGYIVPQRIGLYDVARMLQGYAGRGYTLATTEAGLLPLYSEWRAVDAWGLNDAWIAHHGGITPAYLERYRPEVIVLHAYFSPRDRPRSQADSWRGLGPAWFAMVTTLQDYAVARGYRLAAVFGRNPADTHYYYVRPDFPDSAEIAARIRAVPYPWNGHPAHDYTPDAVEAP
jgi:hypothetical protein